VDDFGAGRDGARLFGPDGTQPPPPPRTFPDPLAGLVTGERHYQRHTAPRVVVPPLAPPQPPSTPHAPAPHLPARAPAHRIGSAAGPASAQRGAGRDVAEQRAKAREVAEQRARAQHVTGRQPPMAPVDHTVAGTQPKKSRGGLIGCLVVLAALSGLLLNVLREIIEAVVDLVR
jgi:hypothetical protein